MLSAIQGGKQQRLGKKKKGKMEKKKKAQRKQQRMVARTAKWAEQNDSSDVDNTSDSQQHMKEALAALLELQVPDRDQGAIATQYRAKDPTPDVTREEAASEDEEELRGATPPIPLFLEQDNPDAFQKAARAILIQRARQTEEGCDASHNTGAAVPHAVIHQGWPLLRPAEPAVIQRQPASVIGGPKQL